MGRLYSLNEEELQQEERRQDPALALVSERGLRILHAYVCPASTEHCPDLSLHVRRQRGLRALVLYPGYDRHNSCLCLYPYYVQVNSRAYR